MVSELGWDSAEDRLKEPVHAIAPKAAAANTIDYDIKGFMGQSLIPETEFGSDRELKVLAGGRRAFSPKREPSSERQSSIGRQDRLGRRAQVDHVDCLS